MADDLVIRARAMEIFYQTWWPRAEKRGMSLGKAFYEFSGGSASKGKLDFLLTATDDEVSIWLKDHVDKRRLR